MTEYRNPIPTVDVLILVGYGETYLDDKFVLIKRKNPPFGWALPGGFVDEGESFEAAAVREAKEETGLDVDLMEQFHTYSDPTRDPRKHIVSTVYIAVDEGTSKLEAQDDAAEVKIVSFRDALKLELAFDHRRIIEDVIRYNATYERPKITR